MEGPFFLPFCYTNSILTNKNNRIPPVFVGIPIEKGQNPLYNKGVLKKGERGWKIIIRNIWSANGTGYLLC